MQSRRFWAVPFQAGWLLHAVLSGRTGSGTKSPSRSTLWQFANYFVMPGQLWSCLSCCFLTQSHVTKKTISQNSTWVPSLSRREVFAILWLGCVAFFCLAFSFSVLSFAFLGVSYCWYNTVQEAAWLRAAGMQSSWQGMSSSISSLLLLLPVILHIPRKDSQWFLSSTSLNCQLLFFVPVCLCAFANKDTTCVILRTHPTSVWAHLN